MNKKHFYFILLLCSSFLLISCMAHQPVGNADAPGFLLGLWHGLCSPITFIISLFSDIRMYAFPNSGRFYDFGFLLGISIWGGGGATAVRRKEKWG